MATELAKPPAAPVAKRELTLRELLQGSKAKLGEVCARHLTPDRLVRLAVSAVARTPKLGECTPASVLAAVFLAGRLGLEPDGALGSAYLVPYGRECQLIVGYRGLVELALRSGKVRSVVSRIVPEKDRFRVTLGLDDNIRHTPTDEEDPGKWTHVYAVATLVDGSKQFEVMSRAQVASIRSKSKAANGGPWAGFDRDTEDSKEMSRKTVIRRLAKSLPLSVELAAAVTLDNGHAMGESRMSQVVDELGIVTTAPASATNEVEGSVSAPAALADGGAPATNEAPAKPKTVAERVAEAKAAAAKTPEAPAPGGNA